MEFLRSLVPTVISGDGVATEPGGSLPRETGPRLLKVKRLGLLGMGSTIEEEPPHQAASNIARPPRSSRTRLRGHLLHIRRELSYPVGEDGGGCDGSARNGELEMFV